MAKPHKNVRMNTQQFKHINRTTSRSFVRGLWPLLKDPYTNTLDVYTAKARAFQGLKGVHGIFRSNELGPNDGYYLIPTDGIKVPPSGTSPYDMLKWIEENAGKISYISLDVEYVQLSATPSQGLDYAHSRAFTGSGKQRRDAEIYVIVFEDPAVRDYLAFVPKASWLKSSNRGYGTEPLTSTLPTWIQPFMVHKTDFAALFGQLSDVVSMEDTWLTNPTTGVCLSGWTPLTTTDPRAYPESSSILWKESFQGVLELWQQIEATGCSVITNELAPLVYDFVIDIPGIGALRVEHKQTHCPAKKSSFQRDHHNPTRKLQLWHITFLQCSDGLICITRDEIRKKYFKHRDYRTQNYYMKKRFRENHTFRDFAHALPYIRSHANAAKHKCQSLVESLKPEVTDTKLDLRYAGRVLEKFQDAGPSSDKILRSRNKRNSLPWLSGQLNEWCCRMRYGLCFALDPRHPLGSHIMVDYVWTKDDQQTFQTSGRLPAQVFSTKMRHKRCVVLRFQDHSAMNMSHAIFGCGLSMPRSCWLKPVRNVPFIIIGNILDRQITETFRKETSKYLVLPSEMTSMFTSRSFRTRAPMELRAYGKHLFRTLSMETRIIPGPGAQGGRFDNRFLSRTEEKRLPQFILNLFDGSINRCLAEILQGKGLMRIDNEMFSSPTPAFRVDQYHKAVQHVLQAPWELGYINGLKKKKDNKYARRKRRNIVNQAVDGGEPDVSINDEP